MDISNHRNPEEDIEITILMPCLNEAESLGICIQKASRFLLDNHVHGEIVIADNGSQDGSISIAEQMGARVVNVPQKGYGAALLRGIYASRGKFVIMGDSDDSYDFTALMPFLEKLREGYDLVMGNRFKGGIKPGAMPPLHQYFGNPVLSNIGRLFFKSEIGDFHCGLRGFRKEAVEAMHLQTSGMEFASEMVIKATIFRMKIAEVPTVLYPDSRNRSPHLRSWQDGWRHLRFILIYSPNWLFLYPGLFLIVIGVILGIWLLPGPQPFLNTVLDIHTLLYAAIMILVGYQSVTFAVFSRVFAINEGLLPPGPNFWKFFKYVKLETGLYMGGLLLSIGMVGSLYLFISWGSHSFGPLDLSKTLRLVIPMMVTISVGFQTILSSFFLSVLGLKMMGGKSL
jgi:glycosyltransferase involved in cell wall biosynthesis